MSDPLLRTLKPERYEDWTERAACKGMDVEAFFFDSGTGGRAVGSAAALEHARAICGACPVTAECLALGMTQHYGLFGGLTEPERQRLRRTTARRRHE